MTMIAQVMYSVTRVPLMSSQMKNSSVFSRMMMILNSVGPSFAYVSLNSDFRCALMLTFSVSIR